MAPLVSKQVLNDMSGFRDFPLRHDDTYLVFISRPNYITFFEERLWKSSISWGTYQCTETVIFLGMLDLRPPQNRQTLGGMLT